MQIKFRPFTVPNFVIQEMPAGLKQDGWKELPSWPLRTIDVEDLDQLCSDFRAEIFKKAEKQDPKL